MSVFSELLGQFIRDKDVKVQALAIHCGLDRSMMYRIINGKRNPPSYEVFTRIADFLHLAPAEYEKLRDAYEIARLGFPTYFKRKSVEKFLTHFPDMPSDKGNYPPPLRRGRFFAWKSHRGSGLYPNLFKDRNGLLCASNPLC